MTVIFDSRKRPQKWDATASVRRVIELTADAWDLTVAELVGPSRTRPLVHYRHAAMAACRELTAASFPAIGAAFGRDHTTVVHAVRKMEGTQMVAELVAYIRAAS